MDGCATDASSSAPARTISRCGRISAAENIGVQQILQKCRRMTLPLAALETNSIISPVMETLSVLNTTFTVELPQAHFWQSEHQQTRVVTGGSAASNFTAPQRHWPVMGMGVRLPTLECSLLVHQYICKLAGVGVNFASWVTDALASAEHWSTTLANFATILGIAFAGKIAFDVRASFQASVSASLRLHRTLQEISNAIAPTSIDLEAALPEGDASRIFYSVYRRSYDWAGNAYNANFSKQTLDQMERADRSRYDRHLRESVFLLDSVLRHAPRDQYENWKRLVSDDLKTHKALLQKPSLAEKIAAIFLDRPLPADQFYEVDTNASRNKDG